MSRSWLCVAILAVLLATQQCLSQSSPASKGMLPPSDPDPKPSQKEQFQGGQKKGDSSRLQRKKEEEESGMREVTKQLVPVPPRLRLPPPLPQSVDRIIQRWLLAGAVCLSVAGILIAAAIWRKK